MTSLFDWAIMNAACASLLAVPAYFSSYLRRPAVTHALWLLVLLRLVAPPLWRVPITTPPFPEIESEAPTAPVRDEPVPTPDPIEYAADPVVLDQCIVEPVSTSAETPVAPVDWRPILVGLWASVGAACFALAFARIRAFRQTMAQTRNAPDHLHSLMQRIAAEMGLRRMPDLRLVDGTLSPFLWAGVGRPVILLPATLAVRLDPDRLSALIAHELAHYRRGDHYVRWLELCVTSLFWWNPVVWLARRELREAEEQLCDAWVVWTLPEARRAYAAALVDTVDFLHESRTALPAMASGLGEVRNLQRRIVMILQDRVPRQLTRMSLLFGLAAGLCLLSLAPGRADDDPPPPPRPPVPSSAPRPPEPPREASRRAEPRQNAEADEVRSEIRRMRDVLARLESRLAEIEGRPVAPRAEARGRGDRRPDANPAGPDGPPRRTDTPAAGGATAPVPAGRAFGGGGGGGAMGGGPDLMRRLDEMQRNMDEMRRDMAELRQMMRRGPGAPGGTPPPAGERRERRGDGPTPPAPPTPRPVDAVP